MDQQKLKDAVVSGSAPAHGGGPARLTLAARLHVNGDPCAEWLLAESCWASIFDVPEFLGLARWIWKVSTCLLVLQFVIPMRRHGCLARRGLQPAGSGQSCENADQGGPLWAVAHAVIAGCYVVLMAAAAMLSVLLSLLLLALAVADKLPIPRIDGAVRWIVTRISFVLGDSYMLAHCPVQFAAMRTQVARDLSWLQGQCKSVAIVAHSQGAAVAHQVLRDMTDPGNLRAFITLGQGISKFLLLQRMDWDRGQQVGVWVSRALVTAGMASAGLPALGKVASRWTDATALTVLGSMPLAAVLIVAGLACITAGVHIAMRAFCGERLRDDLGLPPHIGCSWTDYYTSADPVSNGPVDIETADRDCTAGTRPGKSVLPTPRPGNLVYSNASVLTDHVSYLRNQDQVLPNVFNDLIAAACRTADQDAPKLVSDADIARAGRNRRRLNTALIAARITTACLGAWLWLINLGPAAKSPVNTAMHMIDPSAGIATGFTRLAAVTLTTAASYGIFLALWRIAKAYLTHRFFRNATRHPLTPDPASARPTAAEHARDRPSRSYSGMIGV